MEKIKKLQKSDITPNLDINYNNTKWDIGELIILKYDYAHTTVIDEEIITKMYSTVYTAKVLGIADKYEDDTHYYISIKNILNGEYLSEGFANTILPNKDIQIISVAAKWRMLNNDNTGGITQLNVFENGKSVSFNEVWNNNKFIEEKLKKVSRKDLFYCDLQPEIYE